MTVSIIMKTLNEEKRIAAAVESALVALPGETVEVIVADSGSSDHTIEIARGYPIIVVQIQPPARASCGIGPQLGFQYSHHEFICLMDGDMQLDKDFLAQAIAYLRANPRAAGVTGHVLEANLDNLEYTRRVRRASPENRAGAIDRMNGGGLYRRSAIEEAGYFSDRNLHGYEEFDLGIRLRSRGWTLYRLDIPFVSHYGHTINAFALLVRRWNSGYLRGVGELLRAAVGKDYWNDLLRELPELRLWAFVYVWWLAMILLPILLPNKPFAFLLDLMLIGLMVGVMSLKHRGLSLGFYSVVAWCFHAAALPLGFFQSRRKPDAWIESRLMTKAE
jgi:glycosyltransferase involved in cell wall biosynthesis